VSCVVSSSTHCQLLLQSEQAVDRPVVYPYANADAVPLPMALEKDSHCSWCWQQDGSWQRGASFACVFGRAKRPTALQ